ncbi:MAG: isoleucine--tRNA ligase, partial [Muribaculaceae bacterium]|nr:isoleucine--tRNA ligase [Muribaculaceae bacterium]
LASFPEVNIVYIDRDLEERMHIAQILTSNILALRRKENLKVRQPLQTVLVPVTDADSRKNIEAVRDLVLAEVNVKEMKIVDNEDSGLVKRVKADFKKLGPRFGKIMKALGQAVSTMTQQDIAKLEKEGQFTFDNLPDSPTISIQDVEIIPEDIEGWLVANDGNITVALDVTVTESLRNEGMARELINRIQNLRKEQGFEITDRVNVIFSSHPLVRAAVNNYSQYIASQVLADNLTIAEDIAEDKMMDIDGEKIGIVVDKIS